MKALFKRGGFSDQLLSLGFAKTSEIHLTVDREYEIYAVVMWSGAVFFCVVNDYDSPYWIPSSLFSVIDSHLRVDWIFRELDDEVTFVLGPEFIARDKEAYGALVELRPDAVEHFWKYVETD